MVGLRANACKFLNSAFCRSFSKRQKQPNFALNSTFEAREFSSAGSEHLPYKQRVTGSNPVTPT